MRAQDPFLQFQNELMSTISVNTENNKDLRVLRGEKLVGI